MGGRPPKGKQAAAVSLSLVTRHGAGLAGCGRHFGGELASRPPRHLCPHQGSKQTQGVCSVVFNSQFPDQTLEGGVTSE